VYYIRPDGENMGSDKIDPSRNPFSYLKYKHAGH